MKRFTIQDLQRPNQQYESRVGDDFQPLAVRLPNLPAVPDLMKIADATSRFLDRKEAHDEQQDQFAAEEWNKTTNGGLESALGRLTAAAEGKEGDDVEKAWIVETRKMVEEGFMPADANITWVRHLAGLEAERVKSKLGSELEAEAWRLSRIVDDNGDRVSREGSDEAFDALYSQALDNPVFAQSETAMRSMIEGSEAMRAEFSDAVYEMTSQAERVRGDSLVSQEFLAGDKGLPGIAAWGNADLKGADRLASIQATNERLQEHLTVHGTPNAVELFVNTGFSHARSLVAGGFADQAKLVLGSLAEVQASKGLRVEDDERFQEDFALAFRNADQASDQQEERLGLKRRQFVGDAETQFDGKYYKALAATNGDHAAALELAEADLYESEEFQDLLKSAEYAAAPDFLEGLFIGRAQAIDRGSRAANTAESAEHLAKYQLDELMGLDRNLLVSQVTMDERMTPADKLKILEDPSADRWGQWRDHQESALLDDAIASATNIGGISDEQDSKLSDAEIKLRRRLRQIIVASDEPFEQITASDAWGRAVTEFQNQAGAARAEAVAARATISQAISQGDWAGVQTATDEAQGTLSPDYLRAEMDRARLRETAQYREALDGPLAAAGRARVGRAIDLANAALGIEKGDQVDVIAKQRYESAFDRRMLERDLEIRKLPPAEQRAARRDMADLVAAELEAEIVPENEQAAKVTLEDKDLEFAQQFYASRSAIDALGEGQTWSNSLPGRLKVAAMDSPYSTTPALEFITRPSTTARRVRRELGNEFFRVAQAGDYEKMEADLLKQSLAVGAVAAEQASLSGFKPKVRLEMEGPPQIDEETVAFYKSKGWEYTPGKIVGRGLSAPSRFTKVAEAEVDPYLTLYFAGDTKVGGYEKLGQWLSGTPDDLREHFYRSSGRPFIDLETSDREFERHQRVLLDRLTK